MLTWLLKPRMLVLALVLVAVGQYVLRGNDATLKASSLRFEGLEALPVDHISSILGPLAEHGEAVGWDDLHQRLKLALSQHPLVADVDVSEDWLGRTWVRVQETDVIGFLQDAATGAFHALEASGTLSGPALAVRPVGLTELQLGEHPQAERVLKRWVEIRDEQPDFASSVRLIRLSDDGEQVALRVTDSSLGFVVSPRLSSAELERVRTIVTHGLRPEIRAGWVDVRFPRVAVRPQATVS